ncbi:MAG: tail fiber protein [Pseudolabrys sp.]
MDFFIGQISIYGFNFAPRGWSFCSGTLISIQQNTALFSLLGTTYGGNGQTTFGLPDLRSRTPVHSPSSGGNVVLGEMAGMESVTVSMSQMPLHTHAFMVTNTQGDKSTDVANTFAMAVHGSGNTPVNAYGGPANTPLASATITNAGGSTPHNNLQPFLGLNFCVAMTGIYPSRN